MSDKFDPKIRDIMQALHAHGFKLKGIRNGIRAKLETGVNIDIYTLKTDPSQLRARLRLNQKSPRERQQVISGVREVLQLGLEKLVKVEPFRCSRHGDGEYHYYAHINMLADIDKGVDVVLEVLEANAIRDEDAPLQESEALLEAEIISEVEVDPEIISEVEVDPEIDLSAESGKAESAGNRSDIDKIVELLEPVDAKMFRNGVDLLGLPRSSILRVSLTHIYRAAMDPGELKAAIALEAEKIVSQSDKDALQSIKEKNKTDFLDPVIHALWDAVCREMTIVLE